jgi:nicotinamide-nucleotide amidase
MKAILLSIGDELLIGQTLNTNVSWISQRLNAIGVDVIRMITLSDNEQDIYERLDNALSESNIVLITGGLGPTSDDMTKDVLIKYFKSDTYIDNIALENIKKIYHSRGRTLNESIEEMAVLPSNCIPMYNEVGTAPGMLFHKGGRVVGVMPGVPYEMQFMVDKYILPFIVNNFSLNTILHKHFLTAGKGETQLAEKLVAFEKELPTNFKLAYLPSVGKVKLRLTAKGERKEELQQSFEQECNKIDQILSSDVYGHDEEVFESIIGNQLLSKNLKLSTAESCTGGYISHLITSVSGSSAYYNGSIIAYSNDIKRNILGVEESILAQHGAVSEPCVEAMLDGVNKLLHTDIAIAVSGIAGPQGGTPQKPVGTIVIGVGTLTEKKIKTFTLTNNRERNIQLSAIIALEMLRRFLLR